MLRVTWNMALQMKKKFEGLGDIISFPPAIRPERKERPGVAHGDGGAEAARVTGEVPYY